MPAVITLGILLVTLVALGGLRVVRPRSTYTWAIAVTGAFLAWASVFFWQLSLPTLLPVASWTPATLFPVSPALKMDAVAWLYALSLTGLALAVILTSPVRLTGISPVAWLGTLVLTALGILAFLADNPLTLVMIWTAIDLVEFWNALRVAANAEMSERVVVAFSLRALGTGFALWASVTSAAVGTTFLFETLRPQSGIFLLLAAGLRLGVLPLHLAYQAEPVVRRGLGTVLRLTAVASSLVLLARLPQNAFTGSWPLALQTFVLLTAVYAGWKWLTGADALSARPYWLIGMSALALAAALRNNPLGAAAWGVALILVGGATFLYSARAPWLTRVLTLVALAALGLPFTLTATGWQGALPWFLWPLAILAQMLLLAGVARHLLSPGESPWSDLPQGLRAAYLAGLAIFPLLAVLIGLWGWAGALQLGVWGAGLMALVSSLALLGFFGRFSEFSLPVTRLSGLTHGQETLMAGLGSLYRTLRAVTEFISGLLEGDGGLLWTLFLLVLFILIFQGR